MKRMSTDLFKIENPLPLLLRFYEFHEELMVLNRKGLGSKKCKRALAICQLASGLPPRPFPSSTNYFHHNINIKI